MLPKRIPVDGVPTAEAPFNLRDDRWSIALDQRFFGRHKLLVAFANVDGTFRGLVFADCRKDVLGAFEACLSYLGEGDSIAVAYCDEKVHKGPASQDLVDRFARARTAAASYSIWLEDWISCRGDNFRSMAVSVGDPI